MVPSSVLSQNTGLTQEIKMDVSRVKHLLPHSKTTTKQCLEQHCIGLPGVFYGFSIGSLCSPVFVIRACFYQQHLVSVKTFNQLEDS